MAFADFETADGQPVELLTFNNGGQVFTRSNTVRPVQIGATIYEPLPYDRSKFAQSKDSDDNNITMIVPADFEVTTLFDGILTSNVTNVVIERFHNNDPSQQLQVLWRGRVIGVNYVEDDIELSLQPVTAGGESVPRDVFSAQCNAMLFDTPGCTLARNDWKFDGTIATLSADGIDFSVVGLRVQAAALDAAQGGPTGPLTTEELDLFWQGGYIELNNGEVRDIVVGNHLANPDAFQIDQPFRDANVADNCVVFAGCDLLRATCHKKFNNVINFQGYPDIPEIDPANTELPPGGRDSGSKFAGIQG